MNLLGISLRNVRIRAVSSALTAIGIVVATGLYAAILLMIDQTDRFYKGSVSGYQAVIGTKDSSQLELCLNTIFHVGSAPGTVPVRLYEAVREGGLGPRTDVAYCIPQGRGDTFSPNNYPVIGTTDEMFSKFQRGSGDGRAPLAFAEGEPWDYSHEDFMGTCEAIAAHENAAILEDFDPEDRPIPVSEDWKFAVVGSRVARVLDLSLGDTITPVHGRHGEVGSHAHNEAACAIKGILAPTNSPLDSAIFVPLGVQLVLGGHRAVDPKPTKPGKLPDEYVRGDVKLTALVCDPLDHFGATLIRTALSTNPDGQSAWPQDVIPKFLRTIGNISGALEVVAWLVLLVAAISIAVAMYNTMNERRREIAIMRSLGARRWQIAVIVLLEAALLSLLGAVLGVLLCHIVAWASQTMVEDLVGVHMDWTAFSLAELWLILGVTCLGAVAGILPAAKGSMTQVADNLAPTS